MGVGDINLIAKVAPKDDAFTGMVDADQVIGGGGAGTLPDACVHVDNVTQHQGAIDHDALANTHDLEGTSILSAGPEDDGDVLTADGAGGATWEAPAGGGAIDIGGVPVANDYARWTDGDTLEGRSYAEVKGDLDLEIGTDVLAEQAIGIADDNLMEVDDADAADNDYAKFTANGLEGRSYAEVKQDLDLEIGTDVLAEQTIGIADNNLVEIDHADVADNDYAKFTAGGLEGRSYAEVLSDIGAVEAHAMLDGSVHTDSVADGVTRGSLIYGNATPKWDELEVGDDAQYLGTDGTDAAWQGLDIVDDPSPQLGADLDCNGNDITGITNLESADDINIKPDNDGVNYAAFSTGGGVTTLVFTGTGLIAAVGDLVNLSSTMLVATNKKLQFHDTDIFIHASADGNMAIDADVLTTIGHTGVTRIGDGADHYTEFAADGLMTMVGDARVMQNQEVDLSKMKLGVGSPPGESLEDGFPTLDFDKAGEEEVFIVTHTPTNYAAGTDVTMHHEFFVDVVDGAVQRAVRWGAEYKVIQHGDPFSFAGGTTTVEHTVEIPITTDNTGLLVCEHLTFLAANLPGEGLLLIRFYRDATHGDDDHDGDARLVGSHLEYMADKLGEAT